MAGSARGCSRRAFLFSGLAAPLLAQETKKSFPGEIKRYPDPSTELDVYRMTDPGHASILPLSYSRAIAHNSGWMVFSSDRGNGPQPYRIDLKTGETREVAAAEALDTDTLTLTPDNRSICYFAGAALFHCFLGAKPRQLYQVPDGWERCDGMSVGPDGTHATFAERKGDTSRIRMVTLAQGAARTIVDLPFVATHPLMRPMRAQILFRQSDQALWMVNSDGAQKRQLKLAAGRVGPADWAPDGRALLYLNFSNDPKQLNTIRECTPDANTEKLVAKTTQYVEFGFNHDSSVFIGASGSVASPTVLLLLRVTQRERMLCEHKSSKPDTTSPRFAPDAQRIYFQSDQHGKPAIYCMHTEKLVEKTDVTAG